MIIYIYICDYMYIYIYIVYVRIYVITIKPTRNLVISSNLAIRLGHQLVPSGLPHQGWAIHPSQKGVGATSDRPISVQPSQCMGICACAVQVVTWCRSWPRTMAALHRNAHTRNQCAGGQRMPAWPMVQWWQSGIGHQSDAQVWHVPAPYGEAPLRHIWGTDSKAACVGLGWATRPFSCRIAMTISRRWFLTLQKRVQKLGKWWFSIVMLVYQRVNIPTILMFMFTTKVSALILDSYPSHTHKNFQQSSCVPSYWIVTQVAKGLHVLLPMDVDHFPTWLHHGFPRVFLHPRSRPCLTATWSDGQNVGIKNQPNILQDVPSGKLT